LFSGLARWLGPKTGAGVLMGEGWGAISFGRQKKRQLRIAWVRMSGQSPLMIFMCRSI
jgi:hypothetical protein